MNLKNFEKWCKFAGEGLTKYDFAIFLVSYTFIAFSKPKSLNKAIKV